MTNRLAMIMPTRSRPRRAECAATAAIELATGDTTVILSVDGDVSYLDMSIPSRVEMAVLSRHCGMVVALNEAAALVCSGHLDRGRPPFTHIGFMGDDHMVRTLDWDTKLMAAAGPCGIVYGNDLHQQDNLPTSVVMSIDIVRRLGGMAPPEFGHLYVDNFWRDLGTRAGVLEYLEEVVIEHMHPHAKKAEMDQQYARVNSDEQYVRDARVYDAIREPGAVLDRAVLAVLDLKIRKAKGLKENGSH
jgi:hypothetical protein